MIPSTTVDGGNEFMHIGSDGRLVHFVEADASGSRTIPMKLWLKPQGNHSFNVRASPGGEGWEIRLIPTDKGVTIDRGELQFHLSRPRESDIPSWYAERLKTALRKMDERGS